MSGFDDFLNDRTQQSRDAAQLERDAELEWEYLKNRAGDLARSGRGVSEGHTFQWFPWPNAEMLVLNYSAATLLKSTRGLPRKYRVYIDRRPAGSGKAYPDDSPISAVTWNLEPQVVRGEFCWRVPETGWVGSTGALADEIAKSVVLHYDEYKKRFPQAV